MDPIRRRRIPPRHQRTRTSRRDAACGERCHDDVSMGYYYGSGKRAVSTDVNGQASYSHFVNPVTLVNDPFDRNTENVLPIGWNLTSYSSPTKLTLMPRWQTHLRLRVVRVAGTTSSFSTLMVVKWRKNSTSPRRHSEC